MADELQDLKVLIQQHKMQYERIPNTEQEQPFWISGVLRRVDADKNTIKLATKATDTIPQTDYTFWLKMQTIISQRSIIA